MWAFFQGIWAQSILDIHANANQAYRAGASYFRLVWLWWCLISKIFNAERWCELPERLDLISFWKIAIVHTPFRHVSPAPILCAALMLGCHMENWQLTCRHFERWGLKKIGRRPRHTWDIQSYNEMPVEAMPSAHTQVKFEHRYFFPQKLVAKAVLVMLLVKALTYLHVCIVMCSLPMWLVLL